MLRLPALLALLVAACSNDDTTNITLSPTPDAGVHHPTDGGTNASDAGPIAPPCTSAHLKVGTGVRDYQAVADGDTVYLYRGPQGGYMIYVGVQASGMDPSNETLCYTETFASSGKEFGSGCWNIRLGTDLGGGWYERVGVWGQVDQAYWTAPSKIRGQDATVNVVLTDNVNHCSAQSRWSLVHISTDPGM